VQVHVNHHEKWYVFSPFLRIWKLPRSGNKSLLIRLTLCQRVYDKSDMMFVSKNILQTSMREDVFGTLAQMTHSLLRRSLSNNARKIPIPFFRVSLQQLFLFPFTNEIINSICAFSKSHCFHHFHTYFLFPHETYIWQVFLYTSHSKQVNNAFLT
jgi:hypothetical protein